MQAVATTLNAEWKGDRATCTSSPSTTTTRDVEKFEEEKLGIHEKLEGYHDDYYITSIIATVDHRRHPHAGARRRRGSSSINGVPLDPIEKTISNGQADRGVPD